MDRKAYRYLAQGIVQGVGYRYFVQRNAETLGLVGWVRNLHDGSVEAYAIGAEKELAQFESALRRGPRHAEVRSLTVEPATIDERLFSFSVRF